MKSISKAMIAVMIAAAMCIVPLFVIEDSAASTIKTDDVGVSFKAGDLSKENYEKLMGNDYDSFAMMTLMTIGVSFHKYDVTDLSVTNLKDAKMSLGNKVTEDKWYMTKGSAITADVEFVATCSPYMTDILFPMVDGTQDLYKEIGNNGIVAGDKLTVKGTITMETMSTQTSTIEKTYGENILVTASEQKSSEMMKFKGDVTFKSASGEYKIAFDAEDGESSLLTMECDFYDVKVADLKADSKVLITEKNDGASKTSISYKYKDVSSKYERYMNGAALMPSTYEKSVVGDKVVGADVECIKYVYYDPDAYINPLTGETVTVGLFNNLTVTDTTLKDNAKMKEFLEGIGTVGDSYSDAESVANGAYENVEESSGSGNSNIIFYVIIGVLAVAVVALAVLLIKKK